MTETVTPDPINTRWRTQNVGALLFAATDRCVRHKLGTLEAHGYDAISDAQLALFLHLDSGGTRLTTLAARARLTKQSMIELVDKAVDLGLVERVSDPVDKRAKIVRFTATGVRALAALHLGIAAVEEQVVDVVGSTFLAQMSGELGAYAELPTHGPGANVGRLLALSARRFADETLALLHRQGYTQVTYVLMTLFRVLDLDGTRLTDLAARAHVTKQSMRESVNRAETLGMVVRRADPGDRRAKVIVFTAEGRIMLDQARRSLVEAERDLAAACADGFLAELKTRLAAYCAASPMPDAQASVIPG